MKTSIKNLSLQTFAAAFLIIAAPLVSPAFFFSDYMDSGSSGWFGGDVGDYPYDDFYPEEPVVDIWVYTPPLADASATPSVVISPNGADAAVTLDGSRTSYESDNPLTYCWTEAAVFDFSDAAAVTQVQLPVGTHFIQLHVYDFYVFDGAGSSAWDADAIIVEVITPTTAVERVAQSLEEIGSSVRNAKPLLATLTAAKASLERGEVKTGLNQLAAFQNKVRAQIASSNSALAEQLVAAAQNIIEVVGAC